ncbi:MAG: DEAD/DEAH box helicase, partial [Chthoniobacterales bacterium]
MSGLQIPLEIPDLWQQEAVAALRNGRDVIVDAPTGAGKTRIFEMLVESGYIAKHGQAVYTVPTRALANDKWVEWRRRGWKVGITTGDISEEPSASVVVATLETQRERMLGGRGPAFLVVDEYQMLADEGRGLNYEVVLALADNFTQLLLLSGSVQNPGDVAAWLHRLGRDVDVIQEKERPVPLDEVPFETLPAQQHHGVASFWTKLAQGALSADLFPLLIFTPRRAEAERIAKKIADCLPPDPPFTMDPTLSTLLGKDLQTLLEKRVGYHHSGLSYLLRAGVIELLAKRGALRVIVATTGLAAGINFSVRSVMISETTIHDG